MRELSGSTVRNRTSLAKEAADCAPLTDVALSIMVI